MEGNIKEKALRNLYECIAIATRNGFLKEAQEMATIAASLEKQD